MLIQTGDVNPVHSVPTVTIGWTVGDLETIKSELEKKGLEFTGDISEADGVKTIMFSDPDGHPMQLLENPSN